MILFIHSFITSFFTANSFTGSWILFFLFNPIVILILSHWTDFILLMDRLHLVGFDCVLR